MKKLLVILALALTAAAPAPPAPSTVVLLVRHAERAPGSGDVPDFRRGAGSRARTRRRRQGRRRIGDHHHAVPAHAADRGAAGRRHCGVTPVVVAAQADVAKHAAEVAAAVRAARRSRRCWSSVTATPSRRSSRRSAVPRFKDFCEPEYDNLIVDGARRRVRRADGADEVSARRRRSIRPAPRCVRRQRPAGAAGGGAAGIVASTRSATGRGRSERCSATITHRPPRRVHTDVQAPPSTCGRFSGVQCGIV